MPLSVVSAARGLLSDDQKRLQAHLDRIDAQARALDAEKIRLERERRSVSEQKAGADARERALTEREDAFKKRLNEKIDERLRQARRDIDGVIEQLKERSAALVEKASRRAAGAIVNTGESGAARADARAAIERIAESLRNPSATTATAPEEAGARGPTPVLALGAKVAVGGLGLEGTVVSLSGSQVDVDVRGKRMRAKVKDLRVIGAPPSKQAAATQARVRVTVDLKPRDGLLSEINVIGCTVDEAVERVSRFLDDTMVTDLREVRIVHGFGTGQLRKGIHAFLKTHPLVLKYAQAPENQGGGGATVVELKD
jgi:DNA mismatch repair protein MutS2